MVEKPGRTTPADTVWVRDQIWFTSSRSSETSSQKSHQSFPKNNRWHVLRHRSKTVPHLLYLLYHQSSKDLCLKHRTPRQPNPHHLRLLLNNPKNRIRSSFKKFRINLDMTSLPHYRHSLAVRTTDGILCLLPRMVPQEDPVLPCNTYRSERVA